MSGGVDGVVGGAELEPVRKPVRKPEPLAVREPFDKPVDLAERQSECKAVGHPDRLAVDLPQRLPKPKPFVVAESAAIGVAHYLALDITKPGAVCKSFADPLNQPKRIAKHQSFDFTFSVSVAISEHEPKFLALNFADFVAVGVSEREPVDKSEREPIDFSEPKSFGVAFE